MTSIPVKEFGYNLSGNSDLNKNGTIEKSSNEFGSSFTKMMSSNSVAKSVEGNQYRKNTQNEKSVSKDSNSDTRENLSTNVRKKDQLLNDASTNVSNNASKKNVSAVNEEDMNAETIDETKVLEKSDEVIAMIAEQLGITKEEVCKAMESLGLTMPDLLDAGKIPALMVELSQETDMLSFATNEQLYQSLQNVVAKVDELVGQMKSDANLSDEEWNAVMNRIQNSDFGTTLKDGDLQKQSSLRTEQLPEVMEEGDPLPEDSEGIKLMKEKQGMLVNVDDAKVTEDNTLNSANAVEEVSGDGEMTKPGNATLEVSVEEEPAQDAIMKTSEQGSSKQSGTDHSQNGNNMFQNVMNPTTAIEEALGKTQIPVSQVDVEKIIQQINDHLKIQIKDGVTQMQMELHPASLGTVNLQIASKNRVITAAFTAQNETVKQALESQVVVLRENLEQAGVKVEAIEVTVESHAFERNLQQQGQSGNGEEQSKKRSTRRINVNELSEEEGLEEADLLTKKIMEANGNTVDYTA